MLRKTSKRISFSPDNAEKPKMMKQYNAGSRQSMWRRRAQRTTNNLCCFQLPKNPIFSPLRLLRRIGAGASKAILSMFSKKPAAKAPVVRSRPASSQDESHHKEAIEDCIEFINSSSFSRSNSVTERPSQSCVCPPTQNTNMVSERMQKQ